MENKYLNFFCINIDQYGNIINARTSDSFQIDTLLNKNFFSLISEDDKKTINKHFFNIVNKLSFEEKAQYKIQLNSKSNAQWYELTITGVFDFDKFQSASIQLYNIHKIKSELQENKEIQASLVELSEKMRTSFFKYDVKTSKFIFINKQIFSLVNLESDEILKDENVFFNLFGTNIKEQLIHCAENNIDYNEMFTIKVNDNYKRIRFSAYQDNYYNRNNTCMNGFLIDVTEQETIKEQLIESRNSTELMSKNRFSLLAKSSHEIRTPLNAILGAVDILKMPNDLTSNQEKWVSMIEKSADSLSLIINDILDFSKIDAGKLTLINEPFDFNEIINDVVESFAPQCSKQNRKIIIKNDLMTHYIGDAGRIKQIFTNFLANAFKFSKSDVYANFYEKENKVYFSVKDLGQGISQTDQAKLFQFFSQIGNHNSGSGLGLSICKSLTSLMNGDIGVISDIGQGSEFWVLLPLEKSQTEIKHCDKKQNELNNNLVSNKTFLIAEDNETNIALLKQIFEVLSLKAEFALNGQEALNMAKEKAYDLIFMDCQMPIMDGLQASKNIRKQSSLNSKTPIIALTAHAFDDYKEKCFLSGMTGFLSKPVRITQITKVINEYLALDIANPKYDEKIDDMMIIFKKNLYRDMQDIILYSQQGELEKLSEKAHSLKSASAWVNLNDLSTIFKLLEQSSKSGDYNKSFLYIKQLRVQLEKDGL